jgi:Fe-S cluster biogenesis protein NfuA
VDGLPDADTRALVEELMNAVMQLHGSGLRRMLEIASKSPDERLPNELTGDATLRSLLLIHDLHPDSLEERMGQALAKVLPYIRSHGGDVEVISIEDGVARLRLKGTCQTCPSSAVTLDLAVRAAIEEFCPDLVSFEVVPFPADPAVTPPAERLVCVGEAALAPV